jgi:hypothetical protein
MMRATHAGAACHRRPIRPDIVAEPPDQELADLACPPMRLLALEPDNQALDCCGS